MAENGSNSEAEIRELIDRFADAFRAKDVDGIMSLFAPEIVSFDILPPLQAYATKLLFEQAPGVDQKPLSVNVSSQLRSDTSRM